MRPADPHAGVGESLQADVMRFMAIIAFCLIAILALVRGAQPPQPVPLPEPVQKSEPEQKPVQKPEPAVSEPDAAPPASAAPAPQDVPRPIEMTEAPAGKAAAEPIPPVEPPASTMPAPSPQPAQQGLSLRFASDQDFLRLVTRGEVRVFAFGGGEVLELIPGAGLSAAHAPARLHELEPDTVPAAMRRTLQQSRQPDGWRWGVMLPARIQQRLEQYLQQGATGALVIDRFGEVRHRGA